MVVASVGTWSGPIGGTTKNIAQAVRVWVRWVNDRGGVAGHPVQFVQADDGGDPARYRALVQEMVERRGVTAFVGNAFPSSRSDQATKYLEDHRVPVIGGVLAEKEWATSWAHFPTGTTVISFYAAVLKSAATLSDKRRFGYMVCVEAAACSDGARYYDAHAQENRLDLVYKGQVSIAQPDFTAECLNARNAGAEILTFITDFATAQRIATSCARQGYRPQYILQSAAVAPQIAADPNLKGALGTVQTFPFSFAGTPASAEFAAAMQQYLPNTPLDSGLSLGWSAGKLFEKAAGRLGEPPTREQILEGLWALRSETLGGLTVPLTFNRQQPAGEIACWFNLRLDGQAWQAMKQGQSACP